VSLGKTILVSHFFGTSPEMDAFTVAIMIPNLLGSLIIGSTVAGLVPGLAHAERSGAENRALVFRSSLCLFVVGCAVLTLLLASTSRFFIPLLAPAFDNYRVNLAIRMGQWASLLVVLNSIIGFATAELLSRKEYALSAVSPAISSFVSLLLLLAFHARGSKILVFSLLAGLAVQAIMMLIPSWIGSRDGHLTRWRHPEVMGLISGQFQLVAVSSIGVANGFVDQVVAALLPSGGVSALNYAGNLNTVVMQVVVMAMSSAVLPSLSAAAAANDTQALSNRIRSCAVAALMLAAPACLCVLLFGETAIRLLFQHGLFRADSTHLVFLAWAGYSFGLIPAAIGMTATRVANAMRENALLFRIGLALLGVNAILDILLLKCFGIIGITLSTAIVYCLSGILLFRALNRRIGNLLDRPTLVRLASIIVCTFVAGLPATLMHRYLGSGMFSSALQLTVFIVAVLLLYRSCGILRFHRNAPGLVAWFSARPVVGGDNS
jgi:putative peptidoglycan lipid II flippase